MMPSVDGPEVLQRAMIMDSPSPTALPSYVLVTPARNEEAFIQKTIESMIHQTFLPLKWVIVEDGSTDKTPEIISLSPDAIRGWSWLSCRKGVTVALPLRLRPSMRALK